MDAIKKKMLAMKMDKENALDRAEQMEQKLRDTEEQKAKLEEDLNTLQKKYANLENEFDKANEGLIEANTKLETAEKRVNEDEDSEELDEPGRDPRAVPPHPSGSDRRDRTTPRHYRHSREGPATDVRAPSEQAARPLAFSALAAGSGASSAIGDPSPSPLLLPLGGGGGGTEGGGDGGGSSAREPSEEPFSDCLGVDLSQDSQLSASTLSLSQEQSLSQGSLPDPSDATPTPDGVKPKRKGSKKVKTKKKVKSSKTKDKESSPSQSSTTAKDGAQYSDTGTLERPEKERKHRSKSSKSGEKSDKKSRTQLSSRRPEPEGGNFPATTFSTLEYEQIINGNEPLFSDVDIPADDDPSLLAPPRPFRNSRLGRAAGAATSADGVEGIFIPCTQLGINSNTMIKYAIIGTELQNIFQVSHRVSGSTEFSPSVSRDCNLACLGSFNKSLINP